MCRQEWAGVSSCWLYICWCVCVCVWRGMSSKNSDSSFAKTLVSMSSVSYCMHPPCSLLSVTGKHNVPSSKSCTFVMTDYQTHIDMTLLTWYEVYKLTLKLGHKVMQCPVWHGLFIVFILYYITSCSSCNHR
jgi:hypothetical protein